jgi:hypothetical protein
MTARGWPRTGARRRAEPSAVNMFVGSSTGGLTEDRTRHVIVKRRDRATAGLTASATASALKKRRAT